jgi:hypothetical protein
MLRQVLTLAFTVSLALGAATGTAAAATKCHGPDGKFIKCPPAAAAPANNKCRDITTKKFAKCSAPNTEPVPVKH